MGCFWSSEASDRCIYCHRKASPRHDFLLIDNICPVCRTRIQSRPATSSITTSTSEALFGKYRCSCGRVWTSRLSWDQAYQVCKSCQKRVYPHSQRNLRPTDFTSSEEKQEHKKEYCQMCQQLGYYCGRSVKNNITKRQAYY